MSSPIEPVWHQSRSEYETDIDTDLAKEEDESIIVHLSLIIIEF